MRIEEKELSAKLQEKINILSDVLTEQGSGLLTAKNGKIEILPINNAYNILNKVYSLNDINSLRNHIYKSEGNYISAYDTALTISNLSFSSLPLLHQLNNNVEIFSKTKIIFYKIISDKIYVLCSDGILYILNTTDYKEEKTIDVYNILSSNFIYNLDLSCITDIIKYKNGLLLSFNIYGIYFIDLESNQHSLFAAELNVIGMVTNDESVFAMKSDINNNIIVFNSKGLKTIGYNQLSNKYQEIINYYEDNGIISVLGDNLSLLHSSKIAHLFKLDDANINWNNLDNLIPNNLKSNKYIVKYITHQIDSENNINIRLLGLNNGKLFFWDIDKNIKEINTDVELSYDDIIGFKINGKFSYIVTKNKIIVFNEGLLIYNAGFEEINSCQFINNKQIIASNETKLILISLPSFTKTDEVKIDISALSGSNNNDIYIKASNNIYVEIYYDGINKINPNYYIKNNSEHIINITGAIVNDNGYMLIKNIPEKTMIDSIVLHKNNYFIK